MVSVKSLVAFYSSFSAPAVGLAPRHGSHRPKPTIRLFAQTQAQAPEPVVRDAPKHTIGDAKRAVNKVDEVVRPADAEAKVVVSAGADLVLAPATTKAVSKGALTKQAHLDDAELTLLHAMPRRLPLPTDTTDVASVNTPLVGTDLTDSGCGIDSRASSPVKSSFSLRVDEEHPRIRKIESKDGFALDDDNHPVSLQLFRNVRETVKVHLGPNGKLFHPLTVVGKMFDVYEVKQLKRPSVYRNRMVTLFLLATKLRKFEDKVARCQGLDDLLVVLRDGFYDLAIGVSRFATAFEPTLAMLESLQQAGVEPELEIDAVSFWKCAPGVLLEFFMALRPVSWVLQFQWKDSTRHGDSLESLHEELSYMIKDLGKLKLLSKLETGEFPVPVTWQRKVGTALGKAWAKVKAPFAGKSKVDVNEGKREPLLRRLLPRLPGRRQQDN